MNKIKQLLTILSFAPVLCQAQTSTENYVQTMTMLDASGSNSISAVQYYNGLGYPTASVANAGSNGETACSLTTYDALGREDRKYVPVPASGLDIVNEDYVKSQGRFYQDNSGFTQNHYDALNRVTAVDMAGDKWRKAGKQNKTEYLANTDADKVLHYMANPNGKYSLVKPDDKTNPYRYYPAGSLTKETSKDADNKTVITFKDLFGNVILQRANDGTNNLDTYYVYDAIGRLCYVLSPQYQKIGTKAINCYEYRYDGKGRVSKKILPGCQEIQYWYDKADRVIAMQDGILRKNNKYRFYMYDQLGRMVVQGLYTKWNYNSTFFRDYCAVTTFSNDDTNDLLGTGYSIISKLTEDTTKVTLEIVNYYDNYDFKDKYQNANMPSVTVNDNQKKYSIGSLTGTLVYATNGEALSTVNVYDQKGQIVKSVRKGLNKMVEDVTTAYTFTGAIDNTTTKVNVKYGDNFVATTNYTYSYGKKTKMKLAVSHGRSALARETEYVYDAIGRLTGKKRQLIGTYKSSCYYDYDVHGWLKSVSSGGFQEYLYYAEGIDTTKYYNGNISAIKWKNGNDNDYQGYIFKYDANNRLHEAVYGYGSNLASNKNYFNEYVEYDYNGNITRLKRRGLADKSHGGFGYVDDLYMSYNGNMLTSVRDNVVHSPYVGATDFYTESKQKSYPLTYNASGSLVSDAGRKIAYIKYDYNNNPSLIVFTDGSETEYVYSATGEKLRVIHITAKPNVVTREVGNEVKDRLSGAYWINYEKTDYLLGGALTLKNGRIDKYQFDEGYCQAKRYNNTMDDFTFCYYDKDHLGDIRQVTMDDGASKGTVIQKMNYYPFGAEFCDNSSKSYVQNHKYNGKEFDNMHGLNTYDYGARQYNPVTGRWDRIDPLSEKYYSTSPYAYCNNNPVIFVDPDGRDGKVAIQGAQITVSTNIYLYGPDATKSVQQKIQGVIDRVWGGQHKYSHQGKNYSVQFNANVQLYNNKEKQNPMFIADSWNPFSRNNYIKVDNKIARSRVSGGDEGIWDGNGYVGELGIEFENSIAHEFGHLLGLPDQYTPTSINGETKDVINDGWEDNIMGNCDFGKVDQRNINDIMNEVMKAYDEWTKAGNTGIFHYDINP